MQLRPTLHLALLGLSLAGCDGLTFDTDPLPPLPSDNIGSGATNACDGSGALTFEGAPAEPGERCGRCGTLECDEGIAGQLSCNEPAADCTATIPLGERCTDNTTCTSGRCATEPAGTTQDRCAPPGMVFIPAGTFLMGSPDSELDRDAAETQHNVTLTRPFFMDRTETSQAAWKALSGGINPSFFQSPTGTEESTENNFDDGPVERVDWFSALAFANARSTADGLPACYTLLGCEDNGAGWQDGTHSGCTGATLPAGTACSGYRLPTESEWEYAARAGATTAFPWGEFEDANFLWFASNAGGRTQPVGTRQPNNWGLNDLLGNVWEWTWDAYGTYPAEATDPLGAGDDASRCLRGGAFDTGRQFIRAATRERNGWNATSETLGFRLVRTLP